MQNAFTFLQQTIRDAVASLQLPSDISVEVVLERPADQTHGDLATTVAMTSFSQAKKAKIEIAWKSPRSLAEEIVALLQQKTASDEKLQSIVAGWSVAGPGFINISFQKQFIFEQVAILYGKESRTAAVSSPTWAGKKVVVEFTDPNPFKQLHIGHAYSNAVGESISRMLERVGASVYQACYQGDVGMHVAKSIWGLLFVTLPQLPEYQAEIKNGATQLEAVTAVLNLLDTTQSPLHADVSVDTLSELLGKAYAAGAAAYEDTPATQEEMKRINFLTFLSAQQRLVQEEGWQPQVDYSQFVDPDDELFAVVKVAYQTGRRWSMEYFELLYGRLGMRQKKSGKYFDYYFAESVVGEYGLKIVAEFLKQGVFKKSDGAIIFPGSEYGLHDRVFVNSLGLPTYEAKELGLAPEKFLQIPYDTSIIITANEIDEYFKVLLQALAKTRPDLAAKTKHLSHGMVRLPEGKMSSRTGNVITALEVLESAIERIQLTLSQNNAEMLPAERKLVAERVGLAAIKYAFLKHSIGSDIAFSFDESLSFTGQSGPYLQYMVVRCLSILEKAGQSEFSQSEVTAALQAESCTVEEEYSLARLLAQYPEQLAQAATEFAPHILAQYLFALAQTFSTFYTNCPTLKEPDASKKQLRLALIATTARVLEEGLFLLGISTVEKM